MIYHLVDHKSYITLKCDGNRVCDFFPFSPQAPEAFVREQAQLIVDTMNMAMMDKPRTEVANHPALVANHPQK